MPDRIKHKDIVEKVRELHEVLRLPTDTGGYFVADKKHKDNPEEAYKPDVPGTIKLYHGGVPGYTLFVVGEDGRMERTPNFMQGIGSARISGREMYSLLVGVINGIKLEKRVFVNDHSSPKEKRISLV